MIAEAAGGDLRVTEIDAAEKDDDLSVVENCGPSRGLAAEEDAIVADDMRADNLAGGKRIGLFLIDEFRRSD